MNSAIIRDFVSEDIFAISELILKNYDIIDVECISPEIISYFHEIMGSENINEYLNDFTKQMFVLEEKSVLSGVIGVVYPEASDYEFKNQEYQLPQIRILAVGPKRNGYGRLLMNYAELQVKNKGYMGMMVCSDPQVREFYIQLGYETVNFFQEIDETKVDTIINCPIMKKEFDVLKL